MRIKRKLVVLITVGVIVAFYLFLQQNPLNTTGFSYNDARTKVTLDLINNGHFDIKLVEVSVNGKKPLTTQLILSYSGQLASSALIQEDPLAEFMEIVKGEIHPKLSAEQVQQALLTKTKPIEYGLSILHDEKITEIRVKYKYLGISFERKINLDTWPE